MIELIRWTESILVRVLLRHLTVGSCRLIGCGFRPTMFFLQSLSRLQSLILLVHPRAGTAPGRYTLLGRFTPNRVHPQAGTPSQAGTPPGQIHPAPPTPPGRYTAPPQSSACCEIRATSGPYASYWNAFLLPL